MGHRGFKSEKFFISQFLQVGVVKPQFGYSRSEARTNIKKMGVPMTSTHPFTLKSKLTLQFISVWSSR